MDGGHRQEETLEAAAGTSEVEKRTLLDHDDASRLWHATFRDNATCDGPATGVEEYAYDPARIIAPVEDPGHDDFSTFYHDGLGQLVEVRQLEAEGGSWAVTGHEEGHSDELKATHDAAGNVTSDKVSTFLYGPRGTLLRQPSAGTGFAYLYDADGRRVRTSREVDPATTVRHFLLPDGTPYFEDVAGGSQGDRSLVFLGGQLFAILDGSGVARHLFSDHIGFPVAVADDEEKVNWQAVSSPFGEIEEVLAGDAANDPLLRYPGQWEVPGLAASGNTRLFYNTHRWYNPAWGRYTQADPIDEVVREAGLPPQLRWPRQFYSYAAGNPLFFTDYTGLEECHETVPNSCCDGPETGCCAACCYDRARTGVCRAQQAVGGNEWVSVAREGGEAGLFCGVVGAGAGGLLFGGPGALAGGAAGVLGCGGIVGGIEYHRSRALESIAFSGICAEFQRCMGRCCGGQCKEPWPPGAIGIHD